MDVCVFNPNSPTYLSLSLESCYRRHEQERSKYEQRVTRIEHASFTPIIIVLSCTGGTSKTTSTFMKRLALLLADKRDTSYGSTIYWIRCRLGFSLIRAALTCLRGCRARQFSDSIKGSIAVAVAEGHLSVS